MVRTQALATTMNIVDDPVMQDVAGQIAPKSRRIYEHGAAVFATWIIERGLTPAQLTKSDIIAYRVYLSEHYKETTASNLLSVARRILEEQVDRKQIESNPAANVRGFHGLEETPHIALTAAEAQALLDAIDTRTFTGLRDYVLILFLLRTGIRRMEAAALTLADLQMEQGHHVAIVRHGKGNKRHTVKVPVEVQREIDFYRTERERAHEEDFQQQVAVLERKRERGLGEETYQAKRKQLVEWHTLSEDDGLFVRVRRGDHPMRTAITDRAIADIVQYYAEKIGVDRLRPHGLRASFITLTLEAGVTLHQVQHAVNHADPRTTLRYQKRKLNLDHNAVDALHFLKKRNEGR